MHLCESTKTAICHSKIEQFILPWIQYRNKTNKTAQLQIQWYQNTANSFSLILNKKRRIKRKTKRNYRTNLYTKNFNSLINAFFSSNFIIPNLHMIKLLCTYSFVRSVARYFTFAWNIIFFSCQLDMDIGKYDGTNAGKIEHQTDTLSHSISIFNFQFFSCATNFDCARTKRSIKA